MLNICIRVLYAERADMGKQHLKNQYHILFNKKYPYIKIIPITTCRRSFICFVFLRYYKMIWFTFLKHMDKFTIILSNFIHKKPSEKLEAMGINSVQYAELVYKTFNSP